jgi:hypothetical protein
MALASQPVKAFLDDSYQLISASSPTVPLQGNDQSKALQFLNELISYYSATGLMLTIAQKIHIPIQIGQQFVTFADPAYLPTADVPMGRLCNLENAWLNLDGVTYPMYDESRNTFFASYKYEPLQGLPRFAIITNDLNITTMQVYPAPSQAFELWVYGKFEMLSLTATMDMSGFPAYYIRYLRWALARELAFYKGRASAWTQDLKDILTEARLEMESVSPVNLNIESDYESLLNGSWRVRAGV